MNLKDLENIEDYYIESGFLCIKLISGDHLRINFNSIEAIKKQFSIPVVSNCTICNDEINYKGVCEMCYTELKLNDLD
jgi:coenzyme F420-reducing hydrogenase beta subunit|tara:strand:+ start:2613 stop:2846 length:234 start_codon:yes stop_codon:yes gene_type:complete